MEFDEVLDVILERHYSLVKSMINSPRQMKDFIKLNDQAAEAKTIYYKILDTLPKEEKDRYYRYSKEKFNAFARIVYFTKMKKEEEE